MPENNIDKILKKYNTEVKRHMSVLSEDFKDQVKTLAEQFEDVQKDVKQVKAEVSKVGNDVSKLREDNAIIKMDLGIIKNHLKKKVDYDEFTLLEQRVSILEAKVKQ